MLAIDRIGAAGKLTRDSASAGLEAQEKRAQAEAAPARNARVDEAAKLYEKQFLREMVKAMRGTVTFGAQKPTMAENIYRSQLDEQYVDSWGDQGGVGLADLIYDQVMERYFSAQGKALKGNKEPIPLTDRDISRVVRVPSSEQGGRTGAQIPLRIEVGESRDGSSAKLQAPWDSQVVSNARLEGGKTALTLSHGPSLRSTLIFQGVASADAQPGARFERGRTLGILSPETRAFLWNLGRSESDPDSSLVR